MPNYADGKIYGIRNTITEDVYVGSTTNSLEKRMTKHRYDMKTSHKCHRALYTLMNELGSECFYIELIEAFPRNTKLELLAREGHYIREQGTLNKKVPGRTTKEWNQENRAKNGDRLRECNRQYRAANQQVINEKGRDRYHSNLEYERSRAKKYYEQHKNQHKATMARINHPVECQWCGSSVKKHSLPKHLRSEKCLAARSSASVPVEGN